MYGVRAGQAPFFYYLRVGACEPLVASLGEWSGFVNIMVIVNSLSNFIRLELVEAYTTVVSNTVKHFKGKFLSALGKTLWVDQHFAGVHSPWFQPYSIQALCRKWAVC